jgi:hypothetical protein
MNFSGGDGLAGTGIVRGLRQWGSEHFGNRHRTGAQLPADVRRQVKLAEGRLLARYPEITVRDRIADLQAIARQADRLDELARQVAPGGDLRDLIDGVRALSRDVNNYADKYPGWPNSVPGGKLDLHGADPLDREGLAHWSFSTDPQTKLFPPLIRAIAVALIEDVLGPEFGAFAERVFRERVVPKDPEVVKALLPPHLYTPELDQQLRDPTADGMFDPDTGLIFAKPGSITTAAAIVVREGMHLLRPNMKTLQDAVRNAVAADPGLDPNDRTRVGHEAVGLIDLQNKFRAFAVEQRFLRELAEFNPSDPRIPAELQDLAGISMSQLQGRILRLIDGQVRYDGLRLGELFGTRNPLRRHTELNDVEFMLEQARHAIADFLHGRQGGFICPAIEEAARRWPSINLDAIRDSQSATPPVTLRNLPGTVSPTDTEPPGGKGHEKQRRDETNFGRPIDPGQAGQHTASPIPGTGFVPDGRRANLPDVTPKELLEAAWGVTSEDLGPSVLAVRPEGTFLRVDATGGRTHFFRFEIGHYMDNLAETSMRAGATTDPHVTRVNARVASKQLARVLAHEIAETLQYQVATKHHPEPGIIRQTLTRLDGHEPVGAPPENDPHVHGRLAERRYLLREWHYAWTPAERERLQNEIHAVDTDLTRLGYPAHLLEQALGPGQPTDDEPSAPHTEPPATPDGYDATTHDGIWTNPPWRGRRSPSLDELIPSTHEEATKWESAVRGEFGRLFNGRVFGGLWTRIDPKDIHVNENSVQVRVGIVDPETGRVIAHAQRSFYRDHNGNLYAKHDRLILTGAFQGRGFAREFNSALEDWYRYSGLKHIEVHASSTVGGYTWARAGYDWAPSAKRSADMILNRLRLELRQVDADIEQIQAWGRGDPAVDVNKLRQRYSGNTADEILADALRQQAGALQILNQAATNTFGTDGFPTPYDISEAGRGEKSGRDASWIGKRAMLGSSWDGVKYICEGGPFLRRYAPRP